MSEYKRLSPSARRAARWMELIVGYILHLVVLPAYAIVALIAWLSLGRDIIDVWQLLPVSLAYWTVESPTTLFVLWSQGNRRASRSVQLVATTCGRLVASVLAWWAVSGFSSVGVAVGLIVGIVYTLCWFVYDALADRRRPTDPAERQAENEAALRSILFPDSKQRDDV